MNKLHTDRQITVASALLLLVGMFALNPLEYRGRTHAPRQRTASRAVRADDHDTDHSRWQTHAFDLNHSDTQGDSPSVAILTSVTEETPQFRSESPVIIQQPEVPQLQPAYHLPSRAPPSLSTI
jgi:hypothetical protein